MLQGPKQNPKYYGATEKDYHLVVSASTETAKMYSFSDGKLLWEKPALPMGQRSEWEKHSGDTPPGSYKLGQAWYQYLDPPNPKYDKPYGWICYDMVDLEGNEDNYGRAGIAIHGGGSGLPGNQYWAEYQKLVPTLGCIRMHNKDLLLLDECYQKGVVYVSVYQDDK